MNSAGNIHPKSKIANAKWPIKGASTMRTLSKRLAPWLHVLLIVTILGSLLPPAPPASASTLTNGVATRRLNNDPVSLSQPLIGEDVTPIVSQVANRGQEGIGNGSQPYDETGATATIKRTSNLNEAAAAGLPQLQGGSATFLGPTPYRSEAHSPFVSFLGSSYFYLENFEDGLFNTPGVSSTSTNITLPAQDQTDSVDADDGNIDGFGKFGRNLQGTASSGITFTFDPIVLGSLPTRVGIVWTDGAQDGTTTFEAFDAAGVSLGTRTGTHADNNFSGGTEEDHFYGVIYAGGVSQINIRHSGVGDMEVDHLQYNSFPFFLDSANSCEDPLSGIFAETCHSVAQPINTSTGNYNYQTTDFSIATVGQPLRFERTYNSSPLNNLLPDTRPLGVSWTHNYDLNLTLTADKGGEPAMVILKAPHGSRLRFIDNGDGTYSPYPGV
jgi:hypothetical protein